ncbi:mitochondrial ubiquitin ligase activator of NFKB 1 [Anolis carolinensis]|uniref:mitochondrial ubiquitin ligase activator of NFKB 1 n=1 Tax=Anolis carolinensis TaxID=28377 RepID=UPI002F2B1FEA
MDVGSGPPSTGQVVLLATSSALSALLYALYRHKAKAVSSLKGAKKVNLDQDLKPFLMEAPGKCVPYAVIEGVVCSVKETLSSQFVDDCKGVIQRLTLREHKVVWNRTTHLWNDSEKVIHQRTNSMPFDLAPREVGREVAVRVWRPLEAVELSLEPVYERFHPSAQSFADAVGHYISGERPKGIRETEEMLRVGASLTGIGELVLDGDGALRLQPPKAGLRYYLSGLGFEALLRKQESSLRLWRLLALGCGLVACAALFFVLRKQLRWRKEKRRMRRDPKASGGEAGAPCVVCMARERSCAFLECGHVCACLQCYAALPRPPRCPVCRREIARAVPLYNS